MLKIAICDDESLFTEELRELLSGYMMEKGLVFEIDTYSSGEALIELGIEVVGDTKVKIMVEDDEDKWEVFDDEATDDTMKEIDEEVNEDFLE